MTQRKPDRFERKAKQIVAKFNDCACGDCENARDGYIAHALRQEHAWMRRMVKEELCVDSVLNSQKVIGWNQALNCILGKLTQRRK